MMFKTGGPSLCVCLCVCVCVCVCVSVCLCVGPIQSSYQYLITLVTEMLISRDEGILLVLVSH